MQLKFYARPLHTQPWPDSHHYGQPRRYIGWQWLAPDAEKGLSARYEPKKDGDVVDTDTTPSAHVEHIKKCCREGAFYAADEATATACGVPFEKLSFSPAGFVPQPAKPSKE